MLKQALRLYDPVWVKTNGKEATLGSTVVIPGPTSYHPKRTKINKKYSFQKELTNRMKIIEDFGVSPVTYDIQKGLSMCSS